MWQIVAIPGWLFWGLIIVYFPFWLRLSLGLTNIGKLAPFRYIGRLTGRLELIYGNIRNLVVITGLAIYTCLKIPTLELVWWKRDIQGLSFAVFFITLAMLDMLLKRRNYKSIISWLNTLSHPHPSDFFDTLHALFGAFPVPLPKVDEVRTINPLNVTFKSNSRRKKKLSLIITGILDTQVLAKLVIKATKWCNKESSSEISRKALELWGARIAELCHFNVTTKGAEHIEGIKGKNVLLFNHSSFLDFACGSLPFNGIKTNHRQHFNLCFLAAKDHFLDNPLIYNILGIGKCAQAAGTIFVDRKSKKTGSAILAINEATKRLVGEEIDIVIYPQGTRARPHIGPHGERLGASYYAVGNADRLRKENGHIKKGALHLAVNTALKLGAIDSGRVNIIPVGLEGTAVAAPKGCLRIQTETQINILIGNPITIDASVVKELTDNDNKIVTSKYTKFVNDLTSRVDESLKKLLRVHMHLERRLFCDIQDFLSPNEQEEIHAAIKRIRASNDQIVYVILDYIYSSHPTNQRQLLKELIFLIKEDALRMKYEELRSKIANML